MGGSPPSYFMCDLPLWNTYNVKVMSSGTRGFEAGTCMTTYPFNGKRRRRGKVLRLNDCNAGDSAQGFLFVEANVGPQPKNVKTGYLKSPGGQCLVPSKDKEGSAVTLTGCGNDASGQQWVYNEHLNQLKSNNGGYCLDAWCNLAKKNYMQCVGDQDIQMGNCDPQNRNQQWQLEGARTVWGASNTESVTMKGPNTIALGSSESTITQSGCSLDWAGTSTGQVANGKITGMRSNVHGMDLHGTVSADGTTISWNSYPDMTYWKNTKPPATPSPTPPAR